MSAFGYFVLLSQLSEREAEIALIRVIYCTGIKVLTNILFQNFHHSKQSFVCVCVCVCETKYDLKQFKSIFALIGGMPSHILCFFLTQMIYRRLSTCCSNHASSISARHCSLMTLVIRFNIVVYICLCACVINLR